MALTKIRNAGLATGAVSNIKEQLVMLCDGQDYTVSSGTYTSANITAGQAITTSYADVSGSSISYVPPSGTTLVMYEFTFSHSFIDTDTITHMKALIDSDEVTDQRQTIQTYGAMNEEYRHGLVIPIGGSASTATGRQATWTSAKTLKIQARAYSSSHEARFHTTVNWDGSGNILVRKPYLRITALG